MVLGTVLLLVAACDSGAVPATPLPSAGTPDHPRDVNIVAKDYQFVPDPVDLVPGETVVLHIVNGGLDVHEAVIGDAAVQDAWEQGEASAAASEEPPGASPPVVVPPGEAGLRVVVASGQRVDVPWTVPSDPQVVARLIIGCHIPGHWEKGMKAAVRVPAGR